MSPVLVDFSHTLPEGLLSLSRGGTTDGMGDLLKGRHFDLDESLSPCASNREIGRALDGATVTSLILRRIGAQFGRVRRHGATSGLRHWRIRLF